MKFRHGFIFILCLIVSLSSAVTSARAVIINPGDTVTVGFNGLPSSTMFDRIDWGITFNLPLGLPTGAAFTLSLLDASNLPLQVRPIGPFGSLVGSIQSNFFPGPLDNTGHVVIDQVTAPFDLAFFSFHVTSGGNEINISPPFVVTPAVPLPPALPLFATGLGALALLGWRRKKKAQAAA